MVDEVILDDVTIQVTGYKEESVKGDQGGEESKQISFDFIVKGKDDYHDITVLLYREVFEVRVPARKLNFRGRINHYATAIPNFEDEGAGVAFSLGLIELHT
jgi:hypothetical protein